jgi:hypothetical protein
MASNAEGPSLSAGSGNGPASREEVYGPLTLSRHVKDDGRALILYSRRMPSETLEDSGAVEGRGAVEARGMSEDPRT